MPKTGQEIIGTVIEFSPVIGEVRGGAWQVYSLVTKTGEFCEVAIDSKTVVCDEGRTRRIWYHDEIGGEWQELSTFANLPADVKRQATGVLVNVRSLSEVRHANEERSKEIQKRRDGFKVVNG